MMNFRNKTSTLSDLKQSVLMIMLGILAIGLCFYPGTMDLDSVWQLNQANSNEYFDAHPPIMSYLWHWLNVAFPFIKGSATIFLFCAILYSSALTLIAFAEQKSTERRWFFFGSMLFFPPALLIIGFIIKDTLMDVNLLLAYAIMLYADRRKSKWLLFISILPLFIGFSARYNSLFAVFPLSIWFGYIVCYWAPIQKGNFLKHSLCISVGLFLLASLFIIKHFIDKDVIHAEDSHSVQFLLAYDLVGVSVRANENSLPPFYDRSDRPITLDFLKKIYAPYTNYYTFWKIHPDDPTLGVIWEANQEKELISYWFKALKNHPKEMFLHKTEIFLSALGVLYQHAQLKANELSSPIGIVWSKVIPSETINGWIYLVILTLIWFSPIKLQNHEKVLFWSGYLYGFSWILSTPNTEQRYFSWVIMSTTVLVANLGISQLYPYLLKCRHAPLIVDGSSSSE
jgi:hypothetical protein